MGSEYIHALFNLFLVLAFIAIVFFLLRKMRLTTFKGSKLVNLIQVVPIGQKEKIILLEANQTLILLGVTANHIETLHIFESVDSSEMLSTDQMTGLSMKINKFRELN